MAAAAPPRQEPTGVIVAGTVPSFVPVTDAMLRNPAADDWLMLRHDYSATSFSPLDEITPDNAKLLQLAWIWPMRDGGTNQPAPVVYDGTLYLANTGGIVQALDARTGNLIWEHHVGAEVAPRGITLYQSLLILEISGSWAVSPQDGRLIALDARTGETVWNVEMPDVYPTNSGPILANGLLIQGGGTCTVYEEDEVLHQRLRSSPRAPSAGASARSQSPASRAAIAGASCRICIAPAGEAWITGSYDPELESHVLGHRAGQAVDAGKPRHEHDGRRALHELDARARPPSSGELAWHYAHAPGETFDLDVVFERVLVDAGNEKWVFSVGKDGVLWKHDRRTGEYLGHKETVFQNVWASFDRETGRPRYRPDILEHKVGEWIDACPSTAGGKNWHAMSFHAPTRQLIIPLSAKAACRCARRPSSKCRAAAAAAARTGASIRCRARTATSASSRRSTSTLSSRPGRSSSARRS